MTRTTSIEAFMNGLIDYARMFPPANLNTGDAFSEFIKYQSDPDAWMLSRFIIHSLKAGKFFTGDNNTQEILKEYAGNLHFSMILSGGDTEKLFLGNLKGDIEIASKLHDDSESKIITDAFESKIPEELYDRLDANNFERFFNNVSDVLTGNGFGKACLYFEPAINQNFKKIFDYTAGSIAGNNSKGYKSGFKLRTGGVTKELFPSTEQISEAIKLCCSCEIPFKATAGLHHPVRHFNDSVNTKMHGFLNVFGAGILCYTHGLLHGDIDAIISDENPSSFKFINDTFAWNDISVSTEEIKNAREKIMISYGSCSFDEPREDLRNLKLM